MPFFISDPQSLTTCEGHPQRWKSETRYVLTRSPFHVSLRLRPMTSTCFSVSALPWLKTDSGTLSTMRAFLLPICIVQSAMPTHFSSRWRWACCKQCKPIRQAHPMPVVKWGVQEIMPVPIRKNARRTLLDARNERVHNWLQVSGATELAQIDQRVGQ